MVALSTNTIQLDTDEFFARVRSGNYNVAGASSCPSSFQAREDEIKERKEKLRLAELWEILTRNLHTPLRRILDNLRKDIQATRSHLKSQWFDYIFSSSVERQDWLDRIDALDTYESHIKSYKSALDNPNYASPTGLDTLDQGIAHLSNDYMQWKDDTFKGFSNNQRYDFEENEDVEPKSVTAPLLENDLNLD